MKNNEVTYKWHEVCSLDDLWEGDYIDVEIGDEVILLIHTEEKEIVAFQGLCPHQEIPLADGELEKHVLTCPSHRWQFDIRTGKGINPEGCQLFKYQVKVEDEKVFVGVPQDGGKHYNRFNAVSQTNI